MTLSLDDVRNKRFRMARKSGYEVLEVDEFVDEVEETFAQLFEENQNLKKQVEALKSAPPPPQAVAPQQGLAQQRPPAPTAPQGAIVVTTGKEASAAVVRLVEMSTEQAERLVNEATEDANRIREEANRAAHQVTTDARTRAERVESEARVNAERLHADAMGRAEKLDRDIDAKRSELFGDLERQKDELTATVARLREFEANYRSNLTNHLRSQIESLESGHAEPENPPDVLRELRPAEDATKRNGASAPDGNQAEREEVTLGGGQGSDTPRLDALLGDQR